MSNAIGIRWTHKLTGRMYEVSPEGPPERCYGCAFENSPNCGGADPVVQAKFCNDNHCIMLEVVDERTPAQKAGLEVGDVCYVARSGTGIFKWMQRVVLHHDDGSDAPLFVPAEPTGFCMCNNGPGDTSGAYFYIGDVRKCHAP